MISGEHPINGRTTTFEFVEVRPPSKESPGIAKAIHNKHRSLNPLCMKLPGVISYCYYMFSTKMGSFTGSKPHTSCFPHPVKWENRQPSELESKETYNQLKPNHRVWTLQTSGYLVYFQLQIIDVGFNTVSHTCKLHPNSRIYTHCCCYFMGTTAGETIELMMNGKNIYE